MLIDDDTIINLIDTRVIHLSNADTKVSSVTSGYEALNLLKNIVIAGNLNFPEMIFLDINMPEMDGWEFLEEMKKFPSVFLSMCKTFMLTSSIDIYDIQKAKANPLVNDFISKPLSVEMLQQLSSQQHKRFSISASAKPVA
jgi:CheY-like chemotaxis protein